MNLNSHFPMHHDNDHEMQYDHDHLPFVPNRSSSSSLSRSCHFFFDSPREYHTPFYDHFQPPITHHHIADENYGCGGGSSYETKSKVDGGLKLTLWKKENDEVDQVQSHNNPMKWMSSKMRVMQKMKKTDDHHHHHHRVVSVKTTTTTKDQTKVQPSSSSAETDLSSNSSSCNYNNNNSPIRVCSDCNTTKTPLWRSGPKGPKSLCNACGIRQRKARRAMAAAAAAAADNGAVAKSSDLQNSSMKIKLQQKGKTAGKNGHVVAQLKKRCKTAAVAAEGKKEIGFEEFLINLSKNLAFHRVFPDDEKDAAILLMALSSGLVN